MEIKRRKGKKPLELAGVRFGQLTAVERSGHKGKRITWLCRCDCGREKTCTVDDLRSGHIKSCGCLRDDPLTLDKKRLHHSTPESCAYILYKAYIHNAKLREKSFNISFERFVEITSRDCTYCGCCPAQITRKTKSGEPYIYNGIDRINNEIGYEEGNCVPCCIQCNQAKLTQPNESFLAWLDRIAEFRSPKLALVA